MPVLVQQGAPGAVRRALRHFKWGTNAEIGRGGLAYIVLSLKYNKISENTISATATVRKTQFRVKKFGLLRTGITPICEVLRTT